MSLRELREKSKERSHELKLIFAIECHDGGQIIHFGKRFS